MTRAACRSWGSARWTPSARAPGRSSPTPAGAEVYWARYDASGERIDGPGVARPEGFAVPGPYVGDPAFADRLGAPVAEAAVTTAGLLRAAAAQLADPSSAGPLVPLYLRRPDAVPPTSSKAVTPA